MKKYILVVTCFCLVSVFGLPVKKKAEEKKPEKHPEDFDTSNVLEYDRYLKEIVSALETDPEFRKKLDKAEESDIRTGKIAHELEFVSHHVRTKLDEIKRQEVQRLRNLATRQFELTNEIDREHLKIPDHLDHENLHTFEIEDLRKLILKTSSDLAEADRKRREEFKQYELQKEFEKQQTLKDLDDEHRKKYEEDLKKMEQKHNQHEKVHHPGNKAQLEEVWEKQDHMEGEDFDPQTFFMIHDVDGNGFWDETEVKALFVKELDKVYQQGLPEDDLRERVEEMERMREHVFKEADTNHDNLISYQEFIEQTKREEFNRDPGWDTVDNQQQYTHQEYLEYERQRQEEIKRLIAEGMIPPHQNMPYGGYQQQQGGYNNQPNHGQQQQQYQPHPGQMQPQYQPQVPHQQQNVPVPQNYPQQNQNVNQQPTYQQNQQQAPQHVNQQQAQQVNQQQPPQYVNQQQPPQHVNQQQAPQHVNQQQAPQNGNQQQPPQHINQQQAPQHVNQQQAPQNGNQQQPPQHVNQQQAPQHVNQQQAPQQNQHANSKQQPQAQTSQNNQPSQVVNQPQNPGSNVNTNEVK